MEEIPGQFHRYYLFLAQEPGFPINEGFLSGEKILLNFMARKDFLKAVD